MTGCGGVRVKNKTGRRTVLCAWNVFESVKLFNTKKLQSLRSRRGELEAGTAVKLTDAQL